MYIKGKSFLSFLPCNLETMENKKQIKSLKIYLTLWMENVT